LKLRRLTSLYLTAFSLSLNCCICRWV
jgi:hypothetical protein